MSKGTPKNDIDAWNELAESYKRYILAHQAFFGRSADRVGLIRSALHSSDRLIAVSMAQYLSLADHLLLFDEWVRLSRVVGCLPAVRDYILSLPRGWVLEHIEQEVEPFLRNGVEDDFRRYLELYYALDRDLTAKLAQRAFDHPDEAIRQLGRDFISKLEENHACSED